VWTEEIAVSFHLEAKWVVRQDWHKFHWSTNFKTFLICDEYVINLFVCIYEVRKGTYKKLLGSSFKIMLPL